MLGPLHTAEFYKMTAHKWVEESEVSLSHGAHMMKALRDEIGRLDGEGSSTGPYSDVVQDMYKMVMDGMMSAVHRSIPHYHINRSSFPNGFHIAKDEEEMGLRGDLLDSDEENEVESGSDAADEAPTSAKKLTRDAPPPQDTRTKKKEEQRKRRVEDEAMLHAKKVRDDKGQIFNTLGPFAAPRLLVRSAKPNQAFASRKTLQQRLVVDNQQDEDDEDDLPACSQGPSEEVDAVVHLTSFMKPLSSDSLKKMSESAKVKLKPSSSSDEFVSQIVKTAVRLGCEKACVLMDKHKIIDAVTTHVQTSPLPNSASIDFLNSLPDDLKVSLGPVLGLAKDNSSVVEMWERMVAMGFLSVLTNLRLGPLKKIAQELSVSLPDTSSTEKYCEAIVFAAFPKERIRVKNSKIKKQTGVTFTSPPNLMRCVADMGYIVFVVQNISCMKKDVERHYSPEFEYGTLKWSLLCMANKESLALYLCQTGSVFCKFTITVMNTNPDDFICNEGTQKFSSASSENDWGFNNVVKFDTLLDPKNGFWSQENDSILIEVGIVFVEQPKTAPVKPPVLKEKMPPPPANESKINQEVALQLLEAERLESLRKKVKQEINKTLKEEEKTRKELAQKCLKALADTVDASRNERNRILREQQERERKEQQERAREQERLRIAQEQNAEMKRKITELSEESVDIANKKKNITAETKELRKAIEKARQDLTSIDEIMASTQSSLRLEEKRHADASKRIAELKLALGEISDDSDESEPETNTAISDENELMNALRQSLAGILGT